MKHYVTESIAINARAGEAFEYLRDSAKLPAWTNAFKEVEGARATMETPRGSVEVVLDMMSSQEHGTVDWKMTFPDGSVSWARSRVVPLDDSRCLYSIVLPQPAAELEKLEGSLDEQKRLLREELRTLRRKLEE